MQPSPSSMIKAGPIKYHASQIITMENWNFWWRSGKELTLPAFRCENDPATDGPVEWRLKICPYPYRRQYGQLEDRVKVMVQKLLDERRPSYCISLVNVTVRLEGHYDGKSFSAISDPLDHSWKDANCNNSYSQSLPLVCAAATSKDQNIKRWEHLKDVKVKCYIEYLNGYTAEGTPFKTSISTAAVDAALPENLLSMLDSGNGADVTFRVDAAEIPAHKLILSARVEYFRRMFDAEMKEAATGVVDVKDVDADVFRCMLRFIYGGILPQPSKDTATQLLVAAERYGLATLKESCIETIADDVTLENACETLKLADTHACPNLKRKCVETIKKNWNTITKQDAWKEVKKDAALLSEIVDAFSE